MSRIVHSTPGRTAAQFAALLTADHATPGTDAKGRHTSTFADPRAVVTSTIHNTPSHPGITTEVVKVADVVESTLP
jgi:hypothetical protein